MSKKPLAEKLKPYRLVKYFAVTSLIFILIVTLILTFIYSQTAKSLQMKQSEEYARLLAANLNHQLIVQFIIPVSLKFGRIQLKDQQQFEQMDKVVKSTLHSFNIEMVNIIDLTNTISYSFDKNMVGKMNIGDTHYQKALAGQSTSKLSQSSTWSDFVFGMPKNSKIITYAPLRAEKPFLSQPGSVIGVVEITQDLSEDYKRISGFKRLVIATYTVVMSFLFLILLFVVKRGEGIIQKQAQERLQLKERLNQAQHFSSLGEMVAAVSHEIRNPLGIIRSSAELLKSKKNNPDSSDTIKDIIIEESERLNNIITDFLNFARPRYPDWNPCRINEIIEKNIASFEIQNLGQEYVINKTYDDNLPEIWADANMLYQAFLNILINAMQSMPEGGQIDIMIKLNDDIFSICIEDEGEGISKNIIGKIWHPFFTTKEKGTGLGLGIVKNIIDAHQGKIRIENKQIKGARVTIELPRKQEK
jgi:signal transduction histidine kinase